MKSVFVLSIGLIAAFQVQAQTKIGDLYWSEVLKNKMTQPDAVKACDNLSLSTRRWKLPAMSDYQVKAPRYDEIRSLKGPVGSYWTSTSNNQSYTKYWHFFSDKNSIRPFDSSDWGNKMNVRCVATE